MLTPNRSQCLALYEQMVLLRQFELAAQKNHRAGRLPGFIHLHVGEEAVAVGVCAHLRRTDWITSTQRGPGHALAKGMSPKALLAELYGKSSGCCGGRGGSSHLYDAKIGLLGANGFVGAGIPPAVGAGISARVRGTDQIGVAFFGDGATGHGTFHESLHFAAAQNAPVIFVCENNLYATATPLPAAAKNADIASRAAAYGLPGVAVDGHDLLAVWEVARQAVERARKGGGPTLIEAKTCRTAGQHEGDPLVGVCRAQDELDAWKQRCPILRFRKSLLAAGHATEAQMAEIESWMLTQMEEAVAFAESAPLPEPASANDHVWNDPINPPVAFAPGAGDTREQNWLDAVRDGIAEEMRREPHLIYFGEATGERGGSFGQTKGLWKEFGGGRMIDTPAGELAFTGASIGASATGCRAIADLMFSDFLFEVASQVIEQAGKLRYLSNGQIKVPMIVRASMGALQNSGPHHSGTYYPIWAHCPGLMVAVPSNPADAKGLMKTALRASDPVIFLEHKALFNSKGLVPVGEHFVPFGQANVIQAGSDLTIVTCGELVRRSLEAARELAAGKIFCEIIDLRTIVPLDVETILASVARTRHLLVVDEAFAMCGLGAEIAAVVMEQAFDKLAAPVGRLHPDPVAHPFSPSLEEAIRVTVEKIIAAAKAVLAGKPIVPRRAASARVQAATPAMSFALPEPARRWDTPAGFAVPKPSEVSIVMPDADLTVAEATVIRWLKQIGDSVAAGETIVEVETEKAVTAVESPVTGRFSAMSANQGATVKLGQVLGTVSIG